MCVICIKPEGVHLPEMETFRIAHESNPHGAGFMVAHPDRQKVIVLKGFSNPYDMYECVAQTAKRLGKPLEELSMVFHWRYATHGSRSAGNCHPFPITDDLEAIKSPSLEWFGPALAHNGVFHIDVPRDERDLSDTQWAIMQGFSNMTFEDIEKAQAADTPLLEGGRIVVLDPSGRFVKKGPWLADQGCFWSNGTYRSYRAEDYEFHDTPGDEPESDLAEDYVEDGGGYCPQCGKLNIETGAFETEDIERTVIRICKCLDCETVWQEEFIMTGITMIPAALAA